MLQDGSKGLKALPSPVGRPCLSPVALTDVPPSSPMSPLFSPEPASPASAAFLALSSPVSSARARGSFKDYMAQLASIDRNYSWQRECRNSDKNCPRDTTYSAQAEDQPSTRGLLAEAPLSSAQTSSNFWLNHPRGENTAFRRRSSAKSHLAARQTLELPSVPSIRKKSKESSVSASAHVQKEPVVKSSEIVRSSPKPQSVSLPHIAASQPVVSPRSTVDVMQKHRPPKPTQVSGPILEQLHLPENAEPDFVCVFRSVEDARRQTLGVGQIVFQMPHSISLRVKGRAFFDDYPFKRRLAQAWRWLQLADVKFLGIHEFANRSFDLAEFEKLYKILYLSCCRLEGADMNELAPLPTEASHSVGVWEADRVVLEIPQAHAQDWPEDLEQGLFKNDQISKYLEVQRVLKQIMRRTADGDTELQEDFRSLNSSFVKCHGLAVCEISAHADPLSLEEESFYTVPASMVTEFWFSLIADRSSFSQKRGRCTFSLDEECEDARAETEATIATKQVELRITRKEGELEEASRKAERETRIECADGRAMAVITR
eukprot:TRINITY_DN60049_c0_g1_i1.p1 TRINITY_DN60049_c0_g1~~TRINITY_DN60049_c0_g1_i1.p1  ORF type:complete len:545 (+),score=55.46 TRINITY_DN60049_c0_g1_i1:21-1655(+)